MATVAQIAARLTRLRRESRQARLLGTAGAAASFAGVDNGAADAAIAADILTPDGPSSADVARANAKNAQQDVEIKRLQGATTALDARIRRVQAQTGVSSNPLRRQGLAERLRTKGFGIKRSGAEIGFIEVGKNGIDMNAGYLRGAGGKLFKASIAMHIVGGLLGAGVDAKAAIDDLNKKGATVGEKARAVGGGLAKTVTQTVASITGIETLATGLMRAGGLSENDARREVEKFYTQLFTTKEELARRENARKEAIEQAHAEVANAVGAAWRKLDHTLPESFKLSGTSELKRFRQELRDVNRELVGARAERARNEAERQIRNAEGN